MRYFYEKMTLDREMVSIAGALDSVHTLLVQRSSLQLTRKNIWHLGACLCITMPAVLHNLLV